MTPDPEQKQQLVALLILKKMDLEPADGGMEFPVVLPSELSPLDEILQDLAVEDLITINTKKARYDLTPKGLAYLGRVIDEAAAMVDELDDLETDEAIEVLRSRNLDLLRARFLWGWYEGELDDLVAWQEQRGAHPVERMWAFYVTSDAFWNELSKELQ